VIGGRSRATCAGPRFDYSVVMIRACDGVLAARAHCIEIAAPRADCPIRKRMTFTPGSRELARRSKCCASHRAYRIEYRAALQNKNDLKFSLMAEMHANRACIEIEPKCPAPGSSLENKRISPHLAGLQNPSVLRQSRDFTWFLLTFDGSGGFCGSYAKRLIASYPRHAFYT
jgi:hypothetical protein